MTAFFKEKVDIPGGFPSLLKATNLKRPFTWLDSAHHEFPSSTRFSIFAEAPYHSVVSKNGAVLVDGAGTRDDAIDLVSQLHFSRSFKQNLDDDLLWPGAVLALSYDLKDVIEPKSACHSQKSSPFPDLVAYFFDYWLLYDHRDGIYWLLAVHHDFDPSFKQRFEDFRLRLKNTRQLPDCPFEVTPKSLIPNQKVYQQNLRELIGAMRQGDFYQANMTRKYTASLDGDRRDVYLNLRRQSPSPYGAYIEFANQAILSASPERFVRINSQQITTHPIKGTRPRLSEFHQDEEIKKELLNSSKDAAELTMIVDLCRHDLAKFCHPGSVEAVKLKELTTYSGVHHLEATVSGKVDDKWKLCEVIRSVFPGGSITGAPKVASMRVLAQKEPQARGFYTGSIFLLDARGYLDSNILIRTVLCDHKQLSFQVGGGIVVDSDVDGELAETIHKAKTLLQTFSLTHDEFKHLEQ